MTQDPYTAALQTLPALDGHAFTVRVSDRRKRIGLHALPGKPLDIAVPADIPVQEVVQMVTANRGWIVRAMKTAQTMHQPKQLIPGTSFDFLGVSHRLRITNTRRSRPVTNERDHAGQHWITADRTALAQRGAKPIIDLYCREGVRWTAQVAPLWARRLGLHTMPTIRVRDIGARRWGVYRGHSHTVDLHWTLFQLDTSYAEYVLVHELVHATRPPGQPHGPHFQSRLRHAMPLWPQTKKALEATALTMWRGETEPHPTT
ncbi:M48 family metallopeptidase [Kitasatospora sp. NPDC088556]|uniref:M48 family metallopeptidase n=1 Tax=Kitasatospora sp. NPDC088556 TaxID=3364076 RepID=UPI0038070C58